MTADSGYYSKCGHKAGSLYKYNATKDAGKNKVMKINEQWEMLKEESHANIQSEKKDYETPDPLYPDEGTFWRH